MRDRFRVCKVVIWVLMKLRRRDSGRDSVKGTVEIESKRRYFRRGQFVVRKVKRSSKISGVIVSSPMINSKVRKELGRCL